SFDWGFVSSQLAEAVGEVPDGPRLCTVRMARRLVPGLRKRNLDAVTAHYGIDVEARHRAYGDALATARILLRLLDEAEARGVGTLGTLKLLLAGELPARGTPEE
ncbi:MAG: PolC-type DNA polymerase III, partial [bacterium]